MANYKSYKVDGNRVDVFEVSDVHTSVYGVDKVVNSKSGSADSYEGRVCGTTKEDRRMLITHGYIGLFCGFLMFLGFLALLWILFVILF